MPYERIKFYQTGSFAAGNRLLPADLRSVQSLSQRSNALTCGHRACQGCGEALGARYALDAVMRATKGKMIAVNATGCLEVFSTPFPETSWQIAWLHSLFGNAPAVASGVAAALSAKGRTGIRVACPLGWGSAPADTIKVARLATESGLFPVFEAEDGEVVSAAPIRHRVPVTDYLRTQARYAHLFRPSERTEVIARIQAAADRNIARFGLLTRWEKEHPDVTVLRQVTNRSPRQALLDAGTEAQLLVVGSRGRGGIPGMAVGSATSALLHHAPCPVGIVRP